MATLRQTSLTSGDLEANPSTPTKANPTSPPGRRPENRRANQGLLRLLLELLLLRRLKGQGLVQVLVQVLLLAGLAVNLGFTIKVYQQTDAVRPDAPDQTVQLCLHNQYPFGVAAAIRVTASQHELRVETISNTSTTTVSHRRLKSGMETHYPNGTIATETGKFPIWGPAAGLGIVKAYGGFASIVGIRFGDGEVLQCTAPDSDGPEPRGLIDDVWKALICPRCTRGCYVNCRPVLAWPPIKCSTACK